jgi:capsule polysaccharide export protein KpsE/RkpR
LYYINKSIERQLYNYTIIQRRADSIQDELLQTESSGAAFVDQNQNVVRMSRRMEGDRLRKRIEILNLMYGEVLKNLEIAKFTLENQTPSLIVVDTPTLPLEKKKMSRLKTAIVGAFLLVFLAAMYVLFKSYTIEKKKINLAA